jgi:hypothetical protein
MYPHGQPGLPDDPVMAYINNLCATGTASGFMTTQRARTTRQHDPTRECNVCVASASSSSKPEPAPRHRAADAQRRARLDKLVEAWRQLDEELALLHQELGMDAEPRDRRPAQDVPVQEQPREANGDRREHRHTTTTDPPTRARMSTPTPMLTPHRSSGRHRKTLPRGHAAARLPGGSELLGMMSTPVTERIARGSGYATSRELSFAPALGARAGRSVVRPQPESASFPASRARGGRRSRDISGQEPPQAQPRLAEHHRGPTTGRERQQPPRQSLMPPQ